VSPAQANVQERRDDRVDQGAGIAADAYARLQPWDYSKLPELFGAGRSHVVETVGDLEAALGAASVRDGQFFLIDVRLAKLDVSSALVRLGAQLKQAATGGSHKTPVR
jgi:TPP-dependent 2-oxoacid decarboxylase